jgi:hypothetical protein
MKLIFRANEKHPNTHTESYEVKFTYKDDDGFWKQGKEIYIAASKKRHKEVKAKFQQNWNGKEYKIISVEYQ